jgi:Transglutaminase-like superfamily
MTAMDKWRRFSNLRGYERGAVIEAAAALMLNWAGLRLAGFRRWKSALEWIVALAPLQDFDAHTLKSAELLAELESAAARNVPLRVNCLERSLTLWCLLRRHGIQSDLKIGARKEAPTFEAHAWVECRGTPLNDPEAHIRFAPFDGSIVSVDVADFRAS